jgi:hypothetical protein
MPQITNRTPPILPKKKMNASTTPPIPLKSSQLKQKKITATPSEAAASAERRNAAALKIQNMYYKSQYYKSQHNSKKKKRIKQHKAEFALAMVQTLQMAQPATSSVVEEMIQGEIDGRVEEETAAATGDTTSGEVEVDTGNVNVVQLPSTPMNFKLTGAGSIGDKLRIFIGWLQITAALVVSFDIPWPPVTLNLFKSLTFMNFNFMDVLEPLGKHDTQTTGYCRPLFTFL